MVPQKVDSRAVSAGFTSSVRRFHWCVENIAGGAFSTTPRLPSPTGFLRCSLPIGKWLFFPAQ